MCLEKVDLKPTRKWGVGYKQVHKDESGYYSYDCLARAGTRYPPIGRWGKDPNPPENVKTLSGNHYTSGFHISLDIQPLRGPVLPEQPLCWPNAIIKVRFRKVVATSCYDDPAYGKQVVAREIMIVEEVA